MEKSPILRFLVAGTLLAAAATSFGESPGSLGELAGKRELHFGAAVNDRVLPGHEKYREILAREFNMVTAENAMKFQRLTRKDPGLYTFGPADELVAFAREHGMKIRGHTLVWHEQTPAWLDEENLSADGIRDALRHHIFTTAGRYRGEVRSWDVVNEAFEGDGSLRDTIWLRALGPDHIAQAFQWAHEADPGALLFYNDYSTEGMNAKSDAVYKLAKRFLENGVPIHGIGLQTHLLLDAHPPLDDIRENIRRLNELGLEVSITEMDVRIPKPITEDKLERQAKLYGEILRIALEAENCREFVLWGFTDRYSWIPNRFPDTDAGLIFGRDFELKPAYVTLRDVLLEK